jgi:nitrate/nitrite transporter NarK
VIGCYFVQRRERSPAGLWKYLLSPLIGFLVCFWIWLSVSPLALRVGTLWSVAGLLYLLVLLRRRGLNLAGLAPEN